jgi:Tfp pilus assembly protein PilW
MSSCKPFAERRSTARGMTLLEVMVSQTIALILIAALTSLVVMMVTRLSSETNVSDAQVRLRQASHAILRDSQGIGGELSQSGDLVIVEEADGLDGSDAFTLFKRDESVCGGSVGITGTAGVTSSVAFRGSPAVCPIGLTGCSSSDIDGHRLIVIGASRSIDVSGHLSNAASCNLVLPVGAGGAQAVTAYNGKYGTTHTNLADVLTEINPIAFAFGTSFRYEIAGTTDAPSLRRSVNGGASAIIAENIADLQVERWYDINGDGVVAASEIASTDSLSGTLPAGANANNFLGLHIGLLAFGKAASDGFVVPPPSMFSNHSTAALPGKRRYRGSFITAAARNRSGT